MDGIKEAAKFHYENSSPEERDRVFAKFDSMDEDNNGKISEAEFLKLMDKVDMPTSEKKWLFAEIDEDRSGSIDLYEFITYYYIINYRPICDCCSGVVDNSYYCCVMCWKKHKSNGRKLFQVCRSCYSGNLFKHEHDHTNFKDNHVLFQAKEKSKQGWFESFRKGEAGSKRQRFRKKIKSAAKVLVTAVVPAALSAAASAIIS